MRIIKEIVPTLGQASDSLIRYLVLVNAGGAAASLSFYGVATTGGQASKLVLLPLSCFVAGLVLAGLIRISDIYAAISEIISGAEEHGGPDTVDEVVSEILKPFGKPVPQAVQVWKTMLQVGTWAIPGSFLSFCLGALTGIVGLALS